MWDFEDIELLKVRRLFVVSVIVRQKNVMIVRFWNYEGRTL